MFKLTKDYDYSINYYLSKVNVCLFDALSRKSSSFSATLLTTQRQIIIDLERMEIRVVIVQYFRAYLASLSIQPTQVEKIKLSYIDNSHLMKIIDEALKGKKHEFTPKLRKLNCRILTIHI